MQMAVFKIHSRRTDGVEAVFLYDNINSTLRKENGDDVVQPELKSKTNRIAFQATKSNPGKKTTPRTLKISLGLSCNYSCEYCSQRFVPHGDPTNKNDVEPFVNGLDNWVKQPPKAIEFWGGEPLVYIKTLVPLAEALREKYPDARFLMITNGALLRPEINEWLDRMGFNIGISHDAMGQSVRGPDPFEDEESKNGIIDLYNRLKPQGRISFNTMIHHGNQSRADVQKWWVDRFGDSIQIGEGSFIDPYDEGGVSSSLQSSDEQVRYRARAFSELRQGAASKFQVLNIKMDDFIGSIRGQRNAYVLGQKCGMDKEDSIAVDLSGNVLTCQNVSYVSQSPNGESHRIGHVSDFENIKLNTVTHWSQREDCPNCPVLQLCKGSCMFLHGKLWDVGCDNSYSDNIPFFAGAIEILTGFIPYKIEGDGLPDSRQNLWQIIEGDSKKKRFPIPVVAA
jgi:uncharacterized protein